MKLLRRLWSEESGQDQIEYGLVMALIATATIASMSSLASAINGLYSNVVSSVTSAS